MKDPRRNEFLAGVVILVAVILFTLTFILAGNFSNILQKKRLVRVHFHSARGLIVNNPVQVSGVEMGQVKKISLEVVENGKTHEREPHVMVEAQVPADVYIAKDSRAEIDVSLTGITVLKIERGMSAEVLPETEAIIGTDSIAISDLSTKLGGIAASIDNFVHEIASQGMVSNAKAIIVDGKEAAHDIAIASSNLSDFIKRNKEPWNAIVGNFDMIARDLKQVVSENKGNINKTLGEMPGATENIKQFAGDADRLVRRNEENLTRTIADLQQTSKNLKDTSSSIKRAPWILLRKPDQTDSRSRNLYTAARDLESSAIELRNNLETIKALEAISKSKSSLDTKQINRLIGELETSLQNLNKIQNKLEREVVGGKPSESD